MTDYLEEFTEESLNHAKDCWLAQANDLNQPLLPIERMFSFSLNRINYKIKSESYAYGIFDQNTKECLALVDIVHSTNNPQKKLIKMLTVDLCPKLYETLTNELMSELDSVIDVYSKATFGTIKLTLKHVASTIKLYARNDPMRILLTALKERINADSKINAKSYWEGTWLTIEVER